MNKLRFLTDHQWSMWTFAIALGASLFLVSYAKTAQAQMGVPGNGEVFTPTVGPGPDVRPPVIDLQKELATKITVPFTVAVTGDINYNYPFAQLDDPTVQAAIKIIRNADVGFGNLEAGTMNAEFNDTDIADDLKAMGFNVLTRANNNDLTNMFQLPATPETIARVGQLLRERGIMWAGRGMNLDEARAAQFLQTSKGRIGLVGMVSISPVGAGGTSATYAFRDSPGIAMANGLHLTVYQVVSRDQLEALRKIRDSFYAHRTELGGAYPVPPIPASELKDRLQLTRLGDRYRVGDKPGTLSFSMDPSDEHDILRSIRNGKESSDFLITTIHSHEEEGATSVPDFLIKLAHEAIDNGADMWVGHGTHYLRGIEIYKGRPIFYDLANFTFQGNLKQPRLDDWLSRGLNPYTSDITGAEIESNMWAFSKREGGENWGMVAECKYDQGRLQQVILHPIELGYGTPMSDRGTPHVPPPEIAQNILHHMQDLSKPFGTTITIEGNVGVIHVAAAGTEQR